MIRSGDLDRRVTIQSATITRGELGGHAETWTDDATVWAKVRDLSGRETFAAQQAGSTVSKIVTIRYRTSLNAAMRIILPGGAVAKIANILTHGRNDYQEIHCEVVNGN